MKFPIEISDGFTGQESRLVKTRHEIITPDPCQELGTKKAYFGVETKKN